MANIINSIGYSLGKLHTGMICYLCDLWNEGQKDPLRILMEKLGINLTTNILYAHPEWNGIDLVIFDGLSNDPVVAIEMKVDDHEHKTSRKIKGEKVTDHQTIIYPKLLSECEHFLFITLGCGEYFRPPQGDKFRWIKLKDMIDALEVYTNDTDIIINSWKKALSEEFQLQKQAIDNNRKDLKKYRTGTWNIYVLGNLKTQLMNSINDNLKTVIPTVYMHGQRPDTILNFGWSKDPYYLEINFNGRLNLKAGLIGTKEEKEVFVKESLNKFIKMYENFDYSINNRKGYGKSKTLMSFDIALDNDNGFFKYKEDIHDTIRILSEILIKFFSSSSIPKKNKDVDVEEYV